MSPSRPARLASVVLVASFLAACGCPPPPGCPPCPPTPTPEPTPTPAPTATTAMRPVTVAEMPRLVDGADLAGLHEAIQQSVIWLGSQAGELVYGPRTVSVARLREALVALDQLVGTGPGADALAAYVAEHFEVMTSVGDVAGEVLVTGYYEPMIRASLRRRRGFTVPVYGPPRDRMVVDLEPFGERFAGQKIVARLESGKVLPYWTRDQLRTAAPLAGKGLELAWAADPVDLFFVEVQGSGTLLLEEGGERRIGYAGSNGHTYRSVGKLLIDEGKVERERMSMQAIREYLDAHPDDLERVLDYNPSKVFFRFLESGAVGSLGRPVTAGRSVATDRHLFPKGALAFLQTSFPEVAADGTIGDGATLARFVLNQDTGGAIRGPDRVDLFWGRGPEAGAAAGRMRHKGRLYFLVPR